jgi:hypothetical protein
MVEKVNVGDNSIDSKNINPNRRAIHIWNLVEYADYYSCGST